MSGNKVSLPFAADYVGQQSKPTFCRRLRLATKQAYLLPQTMSGSQKLFPLFQQRLDVDIDVHTRPAASSAFGTALERPDFLLQQLYAALGGEQVSLKLTACLEQ